jgi:flavorubredoxin
MTETARKAGFEIHEADLQIKYVPTHEALQRCFELGKQIAAEIKAKP